MGIGIIEEYIRYCKYNSTSNVIIRGAALQLKERHRSYQWAQIERKLIDSDNIGFVRPIDPKGIVFYLDPSPFLLTQKNIFYICQETIPPKRGELVRVTVKSEEEEYERERWNYSDGSPSFHRNVFKFINSWIKVDPNLIATKRKIIEPIELMNYFTAPFIGDETYVEKASTCAVLSFLSASPVGQGIGGINTAVIGKLKFWKPFERMMNIIPTDFKRPSADYYYLFSKMEKEVHLTNNKEVNLTFHNPEHTPMHIPLVMNPDPDFSSKKIKPRDVKENEHLEPFIVSYLIDSLLFKPEISLTNDKILTDCTYEISQDIAGAGYSPCNLDLGSILPKLSTAFSRLNSEITVKSEYIKSSEELWLDMYYESKKYYSTPFHVEELFKMGDQDRRLYVHLINSFGIEHLIPEKEFITSLNSIRMTSDQYDHSIEILNRFGLIIRYPNNIIKILDAIKPK
jgi:hypothetical protein